MHACVIFSSLIVLSSCVTLLQQSDGTNIKSKSRVELKPFIITCTLSDIVVISAPVIPNAQYYLCKPSGDCTKLNITRPNYQVNANVINNEYDNIIIEHRESFTGISPVNNVRVFNLAYDNDSYETFEKKTSDLKANDFVIGPLMHEDHGNWVLSAYYQDIDDDWIESFQVITIEIIEYVPSKPTAAYLKLGDTFEFSFAYPIHNLTSCELKAPRSTFDRFYARSQVDMDTCGYVISNVTREDGGFWRLTGVGNIVYGTQVYLTVEPK
ncbi:hypothetical protein ABMA28_008206 [Loxostege sticticalis]|uniref:Uncharacterized protein n=1 Tax=Loxostege sticticalis TaxID=481309 RepID=A0ABD0SGB8_LOXSC